jgi:hypothetical protein
MPDIAVTGSVCRNPRPVVMVAVLVADWSPACTTRSKVPHRPRTRPDHRAGGCYSAIVLNGTFVPVLVKLIGNRPIFGFIRPAFVTGDG